MNAPDWVAALPAVNASLNGLAAVLLLVGYTLIRRGRTQAHKRVMLCAFAASILFLACYCAYHAGLYYYTGESSKRFPGTGIVRRVYLGILVSHVVLAVTVPFLASMTIYRGLKAEKKQGDPDAGEAWNRHKRIAKVTFPIWVYVSVTGVMIYWMLYHWTVGERFLSFVDFKR